MYYEFIDVTFLLAVDCVEGGTHVLDSGNGVTGAGVEELLTDSFIAILANRVTAST